MFCVLKNSDKALRQPMVSVAVFLYMGGERLEIRRSMAEVAVTVNEDATDFLIRSRYTGAVDRGCGYGHLC